MAAECIHVKGWSFPMAQNFSVRLPVTNDEVQRFHYALTSALM